MIYMYRYNIIKYLQLYSEAGCQSPASEGCLASGLVRTLLEGRHTSHPTSLYSSGQSLTPPDTDR